MGKAIEIFAGVTGRRERGDLIPGRIEFVTPRQTMAVSVTAAPVI